MAETVRAFIALEIAEEMRRKIEALMRDLHGCAPGVRWVPSAQLHLTLRFLGDSAPWALQRMESDLKEASERCPAAEVAVRGLGTFPDRGKPHVLWLALELPRTILELQQACEHAAVAAGFAPEGRPFRPHLTLGRWRSPASRPSLPEMDLGTTRLERLILFRSELRPQGAIHTPLATFPLGGCQVLH